MSKKLSRYFLVIIAAAMLTAVSIGFFNAQKASSSSTAAKDSIIKGHKGSSTINVSVIGDSLAKGTGDENGDGISTYLSDYFNSKATKKTSIYNAGVDGLKSAELVEELKDKKISSQIADSDLIIISIGGNDILSLEYVQDTGRYQAFIQTLDKYQDNLREALRIIRNDNPDTYILLIGLYNPRDDGFSSLNSLILNTWNSSIQKLTKEDSRAIFVPTNDIFKSNLKSYISSDSLHPNSSGYKSITEKIVNLIEGH